MNFQLVSDDNPKTSQGAKKVPLWLIPPAADAMEAHALAYGAFEAPRADGGCGYGPFNWRVDRISVSTYISACKRHLDALWDGEDYDADSGAHHAAHARACMSIFLDALCCGSLIDDRPPNGGGYAKAADEYRRYQERREVSEAMRSWGAAGSTYEGHLMED